MSAVEQNGRAGNGSASIDKPTESLAREGQKGRETRNGSMPARKSRFSTQACVGSLIHSLKTVGPIAASSSRGLKNQADTSSAPIGNDKSEVSTLVCI